MEEQPGADTGAVAANPAEQQEPAVVPHTGDGTTAVDPAASDAGSSGKGTAITGVSAGHS